MEQIVVNTVTGVLGVSGNGSFSFAQDNWTLGFNPAGSKSTSRWEEGKNQGEKIELMGY